jgi:hypothetical protein
VDYSEGMKVFESSGDVEKEFEAEREWSAI